LIGPRHELANAGEVARGGSLEDSELGSSPKDRRRDLVLAAVQRRQDGRESLLVTRVNEGSLPLEQSFDRGLVAALDRGEELRRHLGLPLVVR